MKLMDLMNELQNTYPEIRMNGRAWENLGGKTHYGTLTFGNFRQPWTDITREAMKKHGFTYYMSQRDSNSPTIFFHDNQFLSVVEEFGEEVEEVVTSEPKFLQESNEVMDIVEGLITMWKTIVNLESSAHRMSETHSSNTLVLFQKGLKTLSQLSPLLAESKLHSEVFHLGEFLNK